MAQDQRLIRGIEALRARNADFLAHSELVAATSRFLVHPGAEQLFVDVILEHPTAKKYYDRSRDAFFDFLEWLREHLNHSLKTGAMPSDPSVASLVDDLMTRFSQRRDSVGYPVVLSAKPHRDLWFTLGKMQFYITLFEDEAAGDPGKTTVSQ